MKTNRGQMGRWWGCWVVAACAGGASAADGTAAKILETAGVRGGLVVHVGCGSGELTAALRAGESFVVHGLDTDAGKVRKALARFQAAGVSGEVSAMTWRGARLPYTDNLVNLLVISSGAGRLSRREMLRVLVPRGVACVQGSDGGWTKTVKPWPAEMDEWTHWDHGPDANPVSDDTLVGPPRRMQWTDGPAWSKKHWGPRLSAMVTAGGRLFCVQDETPTSLFNLAANWVLVARDAFNGVVLWRRALPQWSARGWGRVVRRGGSAQTQPALILGLYGELRGGAGVRDAMEVMVAEGQRLYVPLSLNAPLSALDAATGKVLRTYDGPAPVRQVALAEGILLVAGKGGVRALEPQSGRPLWQTPGTSLCARDGRVFLVTRGGKSVACTRLKDDRRLWETDFARAVRETRAKAPAKDGRFSGSLRAGGGIVLAEIREGRRAQAVALSAAEGKALWRRSFGGRPFVRGSGAFFIDGSIWSLDSGKGLVTVLDPRTGRRLREIAAPAIRYVGHHARCYRARATRRYILAKERGADFVDLKTGAVHWHNWLRGPCHRGVIPANGLLYAGQHSCRCYTETALHGFHAVAPAGQGAEEEAPEGDRLETGSPLAEASRAVGGRSGADNPQSAVRNPQSEDWPTYRHDPMRSGSTPMRVELEAGERLAEKWSAAFAPPLTAPVVATGRLYVAEVDRHVVHAVDANTGKTAWSYVASGRVDSPPTVHAGRVLFGCRDGWVYCLRAADGRLAWRFRAAPAERMVGDHGQIESAWPVHGSILVRDHKAYCVAGRSSFLDGGLYVYALEASTGRVVHSRRLAGPWPKPQIGSKPDTPNRGYVIPGALPDVLVADERSVYLRHLRFDAALERMEDMQPNFYKSPKLSGENRGGDHKYWDNLVEAPRHALFTDPAWFHRSFFQNFPGRRLYATTGLLDDSWHRRMYWAYGQVVGQYIVFRGATGYAVQAYATSPREGGLNAGDGYVVYAGRTARQETDKKLFALRPDQSTWRIRAAFRPVAMVLAADTLILAGPPDSRSAAEALAAVQGRKGALLWMLNAADGRKRAELPLASPPVFDGLAAAGGRLYVSRMDGRVTCLARRAK